MIKLVEEKDEWAALLSQCKMYDFYHTFDYHNLSIDKDDFKLLKFNKEDYLILFPIVRRQVPGTRYFDITSSYGYVGPISNYFPADIPTDIIDQFQQELLECFKSLNIIACFSRLHTLLHQEYFFENFGKITELNTTVYIDLSLKAEVQRAQYGSSTKTQVNKLRRHGFTVRKAESEKDLDEFIRIYYQTMDRLQANKQYYFPKDYFKSLLSTTDFETFILLTEKDGMVAAASMFTVCNHFMQYHLSGTSDDFLRFTPMKLLLEEARLIANQLNLDKFNLGGGYSGTNDSLFEFKSSFSKNTAVFKVWSHILNSEIYNQLVFDKFGSNAPAVNFFPLYRYN